MSDKQLVLDCIERLPDDASLNVIAERVEFLADRGVTALTSRTESRTHSRLRRVPRLDDAARGREAASLVQARSGSQQTPVGGPGRGVHAACHVAPRRRCLPACLFVPRNPQ